jgi:signal transduction histidine kinase
MLEDDGNGFDVEAGILKKNSSGLKNLYSRIELLKGKINIDSTPASGTTISIYIPI